MFNIVYSIRSKKTLQYMSIDGAIAWMLEGQAIQAMRKKYKTNKEFESDLANYEIVKRRLYDINELILEKI